MVLPVHFRRCGALGRRKRCGEGLHAARTVAQVAAVASCAMVLGRAFSETSCSTTEPTCRDHYPPTPAAFWGVELTETTPRGHASCTLRGTNLSFGGSDDVE